MRPDGLLATAPGKTDSENSYTEGVSANQTRRASGVAALTGIATGLATSSGDGVRVCVFSMPRGNANNAASNSKQ